MYMDKENIFCFAHNDLDGVVSAMVVKWFHPDADVECASLATTGMRENIAKWLVHNRISDYDRVFFVDLDLTDCQDLVDEHNVTIIDHHHTHYENMDYQFADNFVIEYSSAALLAYRTFREQYDIELDVDQQKMVLFADDYDSYRREVEESSILNAVFWSTQKNFATFLEVYEDGFIPFSDQQLAMWRIYKEEREKVLKNLQYFENKALKLGKHECHVVSTFATKFINDVADYIFVNYDVDIAIVVNPNSNHVSFRRNEGCLANCGELAALIADGGGHAFAAGGHITDRFLEFSKLLKHRKRMRKVKDESE